METGISGLERRFYNKAKQPEKQSEKGLLASLQDITPSAQK